MELLVVTYKSCGQSCDDVTKQLKEPSMMKYLKESLGVDKIKEVDVESEELGAKIMASTGRYDLPVLALLKGKQVCTLRMDPVEVDSCIELQELPKE